jgi:hypothetical protein
MRYLNLQCNSTLTLPFQPTFEPLEALVFHNASCIFGGQLHYLSTL